MDPHSSRSDSALRYMKAPTVFHSTTVLLVVLCACTTQVDGSNIFGIHSVLPVIVDSNHGTADRRTSSVALLLRGGQSMDPNNYPNYDDGINYDQGTEYYGTTPVGYVSPNEPLPDTSINPYFPHDTVQDRVEAWRATQMEKREAMMNGQDASLHAKNGQTNLMTSLGKGGQAFVFFVMMCRDVHFYEIAEQSFRGTTRLFVTLPLVSMFLANLIGVALSFSNKNHGTKKRLKAILNLDKMLEAILIVWSFIRLTIAPAKHVPREIFMGNIFYSVITLIQCQACTRLNWGDAAKPDTSVMNQAYGQQFDYGVPGSSTV